MTAPKHTPGPWRVRNHESMGIWVDAPCGMVENPRGPNYARQILEDEDYPEKLADAYLIAAAPRMLAALKEARAVLETANECGVIVDTIWCHGRPETLFDFLDAEIERAEGEKP